MKKNKVELPQEIERIAKDLVNIVQESVEQNLNSLLNMPPIENSKNSWFDLDFHILPNNTNEWSNKDFVHYFVQELHKIHNIPYVIEYSRDCSSIKKIKDQLLEINITDYKRVKDFIDWSIKNYNKLKEDAKRFDLPTLNKFINSFLQFNDFDNTNEKRKLGFNIFEKMNQEIQENKKNGMIILLKQFGIPLTASFYVKNGFELDKIKNGIEIRLKRFGENDIILLQNTMQRSIDFSPYPEWFSLIDWRNIFTSIISQYKLENFKWWREVDYAGNFAEEYNDFKEII